MQILEFDENQYAKETQIISNYSNSLCKDLMIGDLRDLRKLYQKTA